MQLKSTLGALLAVLLAGAGCGGSPTHSDFGVDKVRILVNGVLLLEVYSSPFHATWNTATLTNGSVHTIRVEAFDVAKNIGTTQIQVTFQNGVN